MHPSSAPWHLEVPPRLSTLTRAVDVHVDGLLVALRLQEQQLCDNQAGHVVINLQVGKTGRGGERGTETSVGVAGHESGNQDDCQSPSKMGRKGFRIQEGM